MTEIRDTNPIAKTEEDVRNARRRIARTGDPAVPERRSVKDNTTTITTEEEDQNHLVVREIGPVPDAKPTFSRPKSPVSDAEPRDRRKREKSLRHRRRSNDRGIGRVRIVKRTVSLPRTYAFGVKPLVPHIWEWQGKRK